MKRDTYWLGDLVACVAFWVGLVAWVLWVMFGIAYFATAQPGPMPTTGRWGVIGRATVNVNALGDTFVPVTDTGWAYIFGINNGPVNSAYMWVGGCSGTFTTFKGALWTGPGATGTNLTVAGAFAAAAPTTFSQVPGIAGTTIIFNHAAQLGVYFNVSLVQGSAGTCTVWLVGTMLPP